jgi:hypothetical protein
VAFGNWAIAIKAVLDLAAAISFLHKPPMAGMFFSFVLVDLATLWVANAS